MPTPRGRKSAASLTVVALKSRRKPPAPPDTLSEAAEKLWEGIVSGLPADFFRPGDLPLLQAYVVAADRKNQIDAAILKEGVSYQGEPHPLLKTSREEAAIMASLAVKLRLCQSSRIRPESAKLKEANAGSRPWDEPSKAEKFFDDER